jgi:hypothetical protein
MWYYNEVAKSLIYFSSDMVQTGVKWHMQILCAPCLRSAAAKLSQADVRQVDPVPPALRYHNHRSPIFEHSNRV